jgi:predicted peroxiredoxin
MADGLGILLISGGHARAHYAFMLAAGAAAMGREVVLFATNEGCHALAADIAALDSGTPPGVASLPELREAAMALGVRMIACEAGLRMAGLIAPLMQGVEIAGVVTFLALAKGWQVITL